MSAVQVTGVSKIFNQGTPKQVDALIDVNLTVEPGEFVSLIGPSGCGKSTLLRLIANLLEPTTGSITVNGKSASQSRLDQDYGMAFQQAGLFDWRTVAKNIELPLELKGWDKEKRAARAQENVGARQTARVRRDVSVAVVGWYAAAHRNCSCTRCTPAVVVDGRTVWCARRNDT